MNFEKAEFPMKIEFSHRAGMRRYVTINSSNELHAELLEFADNHDCQWADVKILAKTALMTEHDSPLVLHAETSTSISIKPGPALPKH